MFIVELHFLNFLEVAHKYKVISVHLEGGGRQHLGTGTGILLLRDERAEAGLWQLSKEEGGLLLFKVEEEEEEEEGGLRLLPDELEGV